MSHAWLHLDPLPNEGAVAVLDAEEARHASGARRLSAGDHVVLFDGRGQVARARLEAGSTRKQLAARVESVESRAAPRPALRLGVALPKGDRQSTLVSMATQLGVAAWAPLECSRSVARPGRNADERWQRVAISACKQSRNAWLPERLPETTPAQFVGRETRTGPCLMLDPHERAQPIARAVAVALSEAPETLSLVVGPEGGFDEAEAEACEQRGAVRASLGATILRTETAAMAGLAVAAALIDAP